MYKHKQLQNFDLKKEKNEESFPVDEKVKSSWVAGCPGDPGTKTKNKTP